MPAKNKKMKVYYISIQLKLYKKLKHARYIKYMIKLSKLACERNREI